jgi:nicotinamide-nucleotide amidase
MHQTFSDTDLFALAARLGVILEGSTRLLALAESCTGGWVARAVTSVAGSSNWFERGFVTYSDAAKIEMLGVPSEILQIHGAVSEPTVRAMAEGALARSRAHVALAITGIAGPGGATAKKPVGTVWFGWAVQGWETRTQRRLLAGKREEVRRQSVGIALAELLTLLAEAR